MVLARRVVQLAFLALTVVGVFVVQGHTERWCPFGGVEAAYVYIQQGNLLCSLGVSNFYMLGAVLLLALLARRAFCGYACPVGTLSEWLHAVARRVGLKPLRVSATLDRVLTLLKYPVLAVILVFTWRIGELIFRGFDPCYALLSRHGTDITAWAYVVSGTIALASLVITVPFCRWLCPLAAVFAPFSRFGLARVQRHTETCTDCGKCGRACPMAIPVDKVAQVTVAHCTSCLDCVAACPLGPHRTKGAAQPALTWGFPGRTGRRWPQAVAIGLLFACLGGGVAATTVFPLASFVRTHGTPPARTDSLRLTVQGRAVSAQFRDCSSSICPAPMNTRSAAIYVWKRGRLPMVASCNSRSIRPRRMPPPYSTPSSSPRLMTPPAAGSSQRTKSSGTTPLPPTIENSPPSQDPCPSAKPPSELRCESLGVSPLIARSAATLLR